jgi:transcription initiation factor IIF auxiliary subunit
MIKTTVTLEDEIYKKLAREALEKYGRTRSLSRLINEKLKAADSISKTSKEDKELIELAFGSWKTKESSTQYVKRLRKDSDKRFRRLGIE